ncbi:hypothetical protein L1987_87008 [Smallanthus sonchifolius]|uniref:Uncharacterized protein n=1 Tax=Smallanthus sonchifolius TaxID=185202 RepID=A0ACB8Y0Y6_9ASTR|nr:hypothetical protein L1987_87008 [Smallanthus sonchifolius]
METVSKETINESFKVNPPDPGADGKFWETEDSSADSDDDEEQNLINESMKCGSRKRKSKPSSLLDGTLESALRRYSLRSDAGGSTAAQKKHQNKKSKTSKKELGLHAGARSRMDKENDPSKVNLLNDVAMIREDTPTNLVIPVETDIPMHHNDDGRDIDRGLNYDSSVDLNLANQVIVGLEVEGTYVPMNQEYTGNSILDNLSRSESLNTVMDLEDGEEQEVNSDQSNKSRAVCSGNDEDGSHITPVCMQPLHGSTFISAWEELVVQPFQIKWPEVWGTGTLPGEETAGDDTILNVRLVDEQDGDHESIRALCNLFRTHLDNNAYVTVDSFFDDGNILLGKFQVWKDSLLQTRLEEVSDHATGLSTGKEGVGMNSDQEEEIVHKKRKKKNRKGGGKKSKRRIDEGVRKEGQPMEGINEGMHRKNYKIWSSRNRKPEKNLPLKKHIFKEGSIPQPQQLLGYSEFQVGLKVQKEEWKS